MKWGWDFNRDLRGQPVVVSETVDSRSSVRIGIISAMNGRVLEISKRNNSTQIGPEWEHTLFLVPEGMSLHDAIATLLISEGLK